MSKNRHIKKKLLLDALEVSLGIVTTACKNAGVARATYYDWLKEDEDFDLLHLDISNTGNTIVNIHNKYPNSKILFEGGTLERDNIEWMVKYNCRPLNSTKNITNYKVLNNNFPGISSINI